MLQQVLINDVDVSDYVTRWKVIDEWNLIPHAEIEFSMDVEGVESPSEGSEIRIKRGFASVTEDIVFWGIVTQKLPEAKVIKCVCKGMLIELRKASQIKSWDKNIDTEAGVGSEIFKSLVTHAGLSYTSASIPTTGTNDIDKLNKVVQNDEDDIDIAQRLALTYNRIFYVDNSDELVYFIPKGYTTYPAQLRVGYEIPSSMKWNFNSEQLFNRVIIRGATVYDKREETFSGPDTEFTLLYTPEDTEVRDTDASGTLYVRGQKDVGTIGTDFDYYVDVENKTLVFGSSTSDIWIRYGAQVPMPIIAKNQASAQAYGGPNKTFTTKKFVFNDLKDINDAEMRARALIAKFSTPFAEAFDIPVTDDTLSTYGFIKPGNLITVVDSQNNVEREVFVKIVTKTYPEPMDKLTFGDEIWRTEDWQVEQMRKINEIYNALGQNSDILISLIDIEHTPTYEKRYTLLQSRDISGDNLIWGHPTQGTWGTHEWGPSGTSLATIQIHQGNNTYKELFYDDDFEGSGTATWDTGSNELSFTSGQSHTTDFISLGTTHIAFTVTLGTKSGTITTEISGDGGSTWQTVTLGVRTAFLSASAAGVKLRFTESGGSNASISNTLYDTGAVNVPAIKCILE